MMASLPFDEWGIKYITWNLLEASHGKGPADGIGAAVKSAADRCVSHGQDILSCQQLHDRVVSGINVRLYIVTREDIDAMQEFITSFKLQLPVNIKGTMKVHQLVAPSPGIYYHRILSCYCTKNRICECYAPVEI